MPKEWILNSAINRWGLQKKRMVGAVSDEIRKCSPKTVEDWEQYYFKNLYPREYLAEIGRKLYVKVTEVLRAEIDDITEENCIDYVVNLVINRTFDGYMTEKKTIYGQLQDILGVKIEPAPDEWDRLFNVDFFIRIRDKFIGLQIKPSGYAFITQMINERKNQEVTHKKVMAKYGGKVFYVFSVKDGDKKKIYNTEVIEEIRQEIQRLSS
ncbi:MAG: MjaI family restriction endonuclease [candidate division Zixibacteria bacterium RBG_16_53_22]|nr:MAG: MjaI family restriction endonuclease [candidate division Zixibacteria bacterium RBG_16_53_22]